MKQTAVLRDRSPQKCRQYEVTAQRAMTAATEMRESVLEVARPENQTRRGGESGVGRKDPGPLPVPVDQGGKPHQIMAHVDNFHQLGAREIALSRKRFLGCMSPLEIGGFLPAQYQVPRL